MSTLEEHDGGERGGGGGWGVDGEDDDDHDLRQALEASRCAFVLQCVAVCCSVLQCVAVCCSEASRYACVFLRVCVLVFCACACWGVQVYM